MRIKNLTDIKSILFSNQTIKQTIFKNTFWLAMAETVTKLLKLVLLIYVARILGATEYGKFSFAFAFVYIFAILADLGVGEIVIREFAREEKKEKEFPAILSFKILLNLITLILVFISSFFITADPGIQKLVWILAVYLLIDNFIYFICCFFRARQEMQYEAFAKVVQALAIAGAGFFVIFNFPSATNLSYSYVFAGLVALIFLFFIFLLKLKDYQLKIEFNRAIWKKYLLMSWPLALAGTLAMIYGQIDSVMMGYWNQITETGWYSAAYRLVGAVLMICGFISLSFYPALSKCFKESKESLQRVWDSQMEIMFFLAVPLAVGGTVFAPQIIKFVYDSSYLPAVLAFQLLMLMAGICYLQNPFNHLLVAVNQQKKLFWVTFLGAVVNVILNFILIPRFSLYGAAAATTVTWLILLMVCIYFTRKYTTIEPFNLRFLRTGLIVIFSALIMYLAILKLNFYNLHLFPAVLLGASVYFVSFVALKFTINKLSYAYVRK